MSEPRASEPRSTESKGTRPLAGRVVVVTGASDGIGRVTARALAAMGAHVALPVRSRDKVRPLELELSAAHGPGAVALFDADFASLASIRALGAALAERYPRIDVLVNNAGAMNARRELTVDGFEKTFAVNHLGYFLLTHLCLPRLRAAGASRIVNVASAAHARGVVDFDDLHGERAWSAFGAYSNSKLMNVLFTFELARRLAAARSTVTANCLHPGVVRTNFGGAHTGPLFRFLYALGAPFLTSPEKGADTTIYLASSPEVAGKSGEYFVRRAPARTARRARDEAAAARLWTLSAELTGVPPDG